MPLGPLSPDPADAAHVAALAALPGIGPARLVSILAEYSPTDAWRAVRQGQIERPPPKRSAGAVQPAALFTAGGQRSDRPRRRSTWADLAARYDPMAQWAPCVERGVQITWPGRPDYPAVLVDDPSPPGALFWSGNLDLLDRRCVAIVGTRSATPDGRATAFAMGRDLVAAGLCVVSGLAKGIDGAAHTGALVATRAGGPGGTVGVAASGVDHPYPPEHAELWRHVTESGAVISETPPGQAAQGWRFPSRNRVIAGLVEMVVVVESHQTGGSLITAEAAIERDIDVRVVPGPVHSSASAGSNQLLYDGPGPVRDAQDVLDALGMIGPDRRPPPARPPRRDRVGGGHPTAGPGKPPGSDVGKVPAGRETSVGGCGPAAGVRRSAEKGSDARIGDGGGRGSPPAATQAVLASIGGRPATVGQIMARSGLPAAAVVATLDWLAAAGRVGEEAGWWVPTPSRDR